MAILAFFLTIGAGLGLLVYLVFRKDWIIAITLLLLGSAVLALDSSLHPMLPNPGNQFQIIGLMVIATGVILLIISRTKKKI